jgi:hypothetical protein
MNDQMPMFDDPPPVEVPPKKPRKPMKARKAKAVKGAAMRITAQKKRRKRRNTLVASNGSINRVGYIIGAHAQIEHILSGLTKTERAAMLAHLNLKEAP